MIRHILLASAVLMSAPAFAQDSAPAQTTAPIAQTAPADAGQPGGGTPIAQFVEAEFPKYDKDGTGQLTETQFGEWMVALRSASQPGVTAEQPAVKTWVEQAFAQADKDKSKAVSKAELISFLSQGS